MIDEPPLLPAQLVEITGRNVGRIHDLAQGEHVIGRSRGASVRIHDEDASREHAKLRVDAEGGELIDLGSKNGVLLNGVRVETSARVVDGDMLSIGATTMEFQHAASRVARALGRAGETGVTHTAAPPEPLPEPPNLWLPSIGALLFAGMILWAILS